MFWFSCAVLVLQILRSFTMGWVIYDDSHELVTWFGSYFALVHAERRYMEVTVCNTTTLAMLYFLLANSKWGRLFVIITRYLAQLSDCVPPFCSKLSKVRLCFHCLALRPQSSSGNAQRAYLSGEAWPTSPRPSEANGNAFLLNVDFCLRFLHYF